MGNYRADASKKRLQVEIIGTDEIIVIHLYNSLENFCNFAMFPMLKIFLNFIFKVNRN